MREDWRDRFKEPPEEYSVMPFWFWNGTLKSEELKRQMGMMREQGIYGAFMHARAYITTPYLEKEWWEVVSACVEEGEKIGFHPWLYDEYAWPSGTAGSTFEYGFQKPSRTLAKGECNMAKELEMLETFLTTREALEEEIARHEGALLGIYVPEGMGEERRFIRYTKVELLPESLFCGEKKQISSNEPCLQSYQVYCFLIRVDRNRVDYLNKRTIREFIDSTHEEYAARYEKYFGERIPGIFFDEIYMAARGYAWTEELPKIFKERHQYDLLEKLPWLFQENSLQGEQVREDYYDTTAYLYETAFFNQVGDWCAEHRLLLTGHTEENLSMHPWRQGDYFKTTRHLQIPGADCHDYRYRLPRKISFHEPKYSVSVARAYGRKRAMSEAMGGAGWGCSLQEYRRGVHTMGAMGINFFVLHGMYYECDHQGSQGDWPASFFYQNPYWKYFKYFADEIRRICYMNSIGKPVIQIGIYYPIRDMQRHSIAGKVDRMARQLEARYHQTLYSLVENQMDVDVIDEDTILTSAIGKGTMESGGREIQVLLFPQEVTLTARLKEWLDRYQASGGKVLFYGEELPPYKLPERIAGLIGRDVEILEGDASEIYVNHRIIEDCDCYFISNSEDVEKRLQLQLRALGRVSRMDPVTGNIWPVIAESVEGKTRLEITLAEDEACYLLVEPFGKGRREVASGADSHKMDDYYPNIENIQAVAGIQTELLGKRLGYETVTGKWDFLPLSGKDGEKEIDAITETKMEIPYALLASNLMQDAKPIRICNTPWETGYCGRHLSLWKASWITRRPHWQDSMDQTDLYFRKEIFLKGHVTSARICIAAVQRFALFINGCLAGEGNGMEPVTLKLDDLFRKGENLVAVQVHNPNPYYDSHICSAEKLPVDRMISLLLEGEIYQQDTAESVVSIQSDLEWIVNNRYEEGWMNPDYHPQAKHHDPTHQLWGERDGVWLYAWERGQLPLLPWGNLPLYGEELSWPQKVVYQIVLPVGTERVCEPCVKGEYRCRIDGKEVTFTGEKVFRMQPLDRVRILELDLDATGPEDGLQQPIQIFLKPVPVPYGEWASLGLSWYCGRALYRNRFQWKKDVSQGEEQELRYILQWGQRDSCAEIWINHRLVTVRPWAPYRTDITAVLQEGENEIAIVVSNSAAPARRHMLVDEGLALGWNRYWNEDNIDRESEDLVSGLLGPVRIYRQFYTI